MCLTKQRSFVTSRDIEVWKVFRLSSRGKLYNLFYSVRGKAHAWPTRKSLWTFGLQAVGFDAGFGYHCFKSRNEALKYSYKVMHPAERAAIKKLIIPKGTRYAHGVIPHNFTGAGLKGIRAEYLERSEHESY